VVPLKKEDSERDCQKRGAKPMVTAMRGGICRLSSEACGHPIPAKGKPAVANDMKKSRLNHFSAGSTLTAVP
jgi:hypothetical protein